MVRSSVVNGKSKCQIEIAIIKGALPSNAKLMPTHQVLHGAWVKGLLEKLNLIPNLVSLAQFPSKSAQGHIGDRQKAREDDAEATSQFPAIVFFKS